MTKTVCIEFSSNGQRVLIFNHKITSIIEKSKSGGCWIKCGADEVEVSETYDEVLAILDISIGKDVE